MNLLVESLRNQFLGPFFRFSCFLLFIPNLPFFCYLLYFYCSFLFYFFFFFSFFFCFSSFFSLFSFSFCFYYPDFPCFDLYCFLHSFEHLIIFTSPVLQSISRLWWTSHGIPKITLYFCPPITLISIFSLCPIKELVLYWRFISAQESQMIFE